MENLSAYAVYQKKVKGVKSYEDPSALQNGNAGRYVKALSASKKKKSKTPKPENTPAVRPPAVQKSNGIFNGTQSSEDEAEQLLAVSNLTKSQKKQNKKQKQKEAKVTNGNNVSFSKGSIQLSESSPEVSRVMHHAKKMAATSVFNGHGLAAKTPTKKTNTPVIQDKSSSSSDSSPEVAQPAAFRKKSGPVPVSSNTQLSRTSTKKAIEVSTNEKSKQKKNMSPMEPVVPVAEQDASSKRKRNSEVSRTPSNDNQPQKKAKTAKPQPDGSAASNEKPIMKLLNNHPAGADSTQVGKQVFEWLIAPTKVDTFMSKYWEQKPLLIKRDKDDYYKWLHNSEELDCVLRNNVVRFGKNIDITTYENGVRETVEIEGRAMPAGIWSYYAGGCSVRFLNPQSYVENIQKLNSLLQEYFGTFVGSNSYLTPPDSQGFAPHYDDIEAFIIQLEGKKHWKVYKPRDDSEVLPRFSSRNFSEEADDLGNPIIDVVLEEGDLLYLPRGYIHQAKAVDVHSYHLTLSSYQLNSWGDLLKEYLITSIDQMMKTSSQFRQGLPLDYLQYMGEAQCPSSSCAVTKEKLRLRSEFQQKAKGLVSKMLDSVTFDHAADRMGKKFMWDSLPPVFTTDEKELSSVQDGEHMKDGEIFGRVDFTTEVEVRLARRHCARLVREDDGNLRVYFNLENSLEYHGEDAAFVEIPKETENAVAMLINSYPAYVQISQLPEGDSQITLQVISDLWDRRILVTKEKLPEHVDDEDSDDEDFMEEDHVEDEEESDEDSD